MKDKKLFRTGRVFFIGHLFAGMLFGISRNKYSSGVEYTVALLCFALTIDIKEKEVEPSINTL